MNRRYLRICLLVGDLVWIVLALALAVLVRFTMNRLQPGELSNFPPVLLAGLLTWPMLFAWLKLDGFRWGAGITAVFSHIVIAVVILTAVASTIEFLLRRPVPRTSIAVFDVFLVVGLILIRRAALAVIQRGNVHGISRRVLVVGNGPLLHEVQEQINCRPEFLYTVAGHLHSDVESDFDGREEDSVMVWSGGLKGLLQEQRIDEVFVVERRLPYHEMTRLFEVCTELDIGLSFIPQTYEMYAFRPELQDLGDLPFIRLQPISLSYASRVAKRCIDLLLSCAIVPFLAPLLLVLAFYARMTTGRCLQRALRVGREGAHFDMYRFSVPSESDGFGRLCHRLSVTELPQIINILMGDMSWVGPRPESPERVSHYSEWQRMRLRVRPGLTGLAQIHGLRTAHSSGMKAKFDLQYIQSWSPLLDLSVLMQTVSTVLARGSRFEQVAKVTADLSTGGSQC